MISRLDLDEVLRQAALLSNITGAIMDDFFGRRGDPVKAWARLPIEDIRAMRNACIPLRHGRWISCGLV